MKTLVYATDYTQDSIDALKYAHALSKSLNSQLVVLNVYSLPPLLPGTIVPKAHHKKMIFEEQEEFLQSYCKKHLSAAGADTNGLLTDVVENDSISDGIMMKVREVKADLLLIGMKDEHSRRGLFEGNIAYQLLERSTCSILMLPSAISFRPFTSLVYATDFEMGDIEGIKLLTGFARSIETKIRIVHVPKSDEHPGEEQMAWFRELTEQQIAYPRLDFQILQPGNLADRLAGFVNDSKADVLAMLERKNKGLLTAIFHRDTVKVMGDRLDIPVLAIPEN
jgi:nucleotide-binding universal stress UspA family protein